MGWKQRDWYLGPHERILFDANGNAGPTVWCDGRVVGGWSQRKDGEIVFELLEDVGAEATRAIEAEAERLADWLGDVRFSPASCRRSSARWPRERRTPMQSPLAND